MRNPIMACLFGMAILVLGQETTGPRWAKASGLSDGEINALVASGTNLIAATEKGDVYVSGDNGNRWSPSNSGIPWLVTVSCLVVSGENVYAGTSDGVYLSTDNGSNWLARNSGWPEGLSVGCLAVMGADLFAGGSKGMLRSADSGIWTPINSGLPAGTKVWHLAVSGENLLAGTSSAVFLSTNRGDSWTKASSGLPSGSRLLWLAASGTNIFAGVQYQIVYGSILRFTVNGKKWSAARRGIPEAAHALCFAANSTDLFAGTGGGSSSLIPPGPRLRIIEFTHDQGVFRSTDNGKKWSAINSGLPQYETKALGLVVDTGINCLALSGDYLFAATRDGTVWRLPLKDLPAGK